MVVLVALGATVSFHFGVFHDVWEQDMTKLSFVILAAFAAMTAICGISTWKVSKAISRGSIDERSLDQIEYNENTGWFVSDVLLTIGMIGTVSGFIIMLMGGFSEIDATNPATLQAMLGKMTVGMATALYTTLTGLIGSLLLKLQFFNLTQGADKLRGVNERA
jgi:hypothetical protein